MSAQDKRTTSDLSDKIQEYINHLEIVEKASPLTIRNYRHYLSRFEKFLQQTGRGENLKKIDHLTIRDYKDFLNRFKFKNSNLTLKTQGYHLIALRSFLRFLAKNNYRVISPDTISVPKVETTKFNFLSGKEVDKLLNAPSLSKIDGFRDKAILELFYSTGLRVSELASLNRDSIDYVKKDLKVRTRRNFRKVFISQRASVWLEKYISLRKDDFSPMFIRHKGKVYPRADDEKMRLTHRSIQRMIKKYVKKVDLKSNATPQVLRNSFATDLLLAGEELGKVQKMLGHKNVATTQVYTHVTHKRLKEVHQSYHGKGGK